MKTTKKDPPNSFKLGQIAFSDRDWKTAVSHFEAALSGYQLRSQFLNVAACYNNLGIIAYTQGNFAHAETQYRQSLALYQQHQQRREEASVLGNLGVTLQSWGRLEEATVCYQDALNIAREIGERRIEASALGNLGEVIATGNLGLVAHARADYTGALPHFQKALAQAQVIEYRQGEAAQLENVAGCYIMLLRLDEAEAALRQAIPIEQETDNQYGYMLALADLSYVKLLQGQPKMALTYLEEVWPIAQAVGGPELLARLCWSQADVHIALGEMEAAYKQYRQAIEHMEAIRGRLQRESDRVSFITIERARIFGKLVLFLQQIYSRSAEAVTYAERARSRLFLDQLAGGGLNSTAAALRSEPLSYEQICDLIKR